MSHNSSKFTAWVISDGRVGRRNQCLGVAEKLKAYTQVLKISEINEAGGLETYLASRPKRINGHSEWPDVVLSSGDESGKVALKIKELSENRVFVVSLSGHFDHGFDLMVQDTHSKPRLARRNMEIIGVPHKVTPEAIEHGVSKWKSRMSHFIENGQLIIAALIGGDINEDFEFNEKEAIALGQTLNKEAKRLNAHLLITNSPRITVPTWRTLRDCASAGLNGYIYDCRIAQEGNPYPAMLGIAHVIIVTGDSISMCFEATAAGKPVYIATPSSITPPFYRNFHDDLYRLGLAKKFEGMLGSIDI